MDFEKQRRKLVEELAGLGVKDPRVLDVMASVPRHLFVPEGFQGQAYRNTCLPLPEGQTISQPVTVARMLEAVALQGAEKVLEIGTGSGYLAALLARLAHQVFSIERIEILARQARRVLDQLNLYNVNIRVGDGTLGWSRYQPYEAILVSAAGLEVPPVLLDQLAPGGRMIFPLGDTEKQELVFIRKTGTGIRREVIDPCRFVPLIGKKSAQ
jgi:protein-L-isoaspartate(D-aspartate) O-methyltransferase